MPTPKQITIRGPSPELSRRLTKLSRARNESVNTTILRLLEEAVGVNERKAWLEGFATWTREEADAFDEALKGMRVVDDKLWR